MSLRHLPATRWERAEGKVHIQEPLKTPGLTLRADGAACPTRRGSWNTTRFRLSVQSQPLSLEAQTRTSERQVWASEFRRALTQNGAAFQTRSGSWGPFGATQVQSPRADQGGGTSLPPALPGEALTPLLLGGWPVGL